MIQKREKNKELFPIVGGKEIKVDWKLYYKLLKHRSHSDTPEEVEFSYWLERWVKKNVPGAIIVRDSMNCLYITKGISDLYPCMVAHIDINQSPATNYTIINTGEWILGIDNESGKQIGLGHDKCCRS